MKSPVTVVLDNEAVQALVNVTHRKHRRALALLEATTVRNERRAGAVRVVVPTAARVEAGWDRSTPGAAPINRLRVTDAGLDPRAANTGAALAAALSISVADAHIGAVLNDTTSPHAVLTSDARDVQRIASHLGVDVTIVRI